ncbi:hypothetical protein GCM10027084_24090 [Pseudoxanthomonas sangjuensis]|nr:hypothetical protein CSC71_13955 [Pseudoxanthomonas sangjuensis]
MEMRAILVRLAFVPALFAAQASAAGKPAPDAAAMWERFLARGEYNATLAAYDALEAVGYDGVEVDAEQCRQQAAVLASAVETAPVSIALRRAAYLCADATGDQTATEDALAQLVALSRHALKQAGDPAVAAPIRVLSPADAYALLASSGLEQLYEYYTLLRPARYFPLVLASWDEEAGVERHLAFDYVDAQQSLKVDSPYRGMPVVRDWVASGFVQGGAKSNGLAATDAMALKSAAAAGTVADKLAKLRNVAAAGGVQSAKAWLLLCVRNPDIEGCGDGLVDALLEQAEQKRAFPMTLLAYAYFDGIGTKADKPSAWVLLDGADKRWPGDAVAEFAALWTDAHPKAALPAGLAQRLARAENAGSRTAQRFLVWQKAYADKPQLDAGDIAFLSAPEENGRGLGYSVLADYYAGLKQAQDESKWRIKAAESGHAAQQAWYAGALLFGNDEGIARDDAGGMKFAVAAAHGGDIWTARYLSDRSVRSGNYVAAEGWLLSPADAGNIDAIMQLADLYAAERPGVSGNLERAVELYRLIAGQGDEAGAPARRALAELALEGRGMAKDPAQAQRWLKQDAERGDHLSEILLAGHYLKGDFGKPDEAEGTRLLQRAIKAGDEDAVTSYGAWLYYDKDTAESRAQALKLLAEADAAGNKGATNNYVWLLCTSPRAEVYDPKRGLEISKRLGDVETLSPGVLDTVAACHAANGDFARAVELQARAAKEMAAYTTERARKERNGKPFGYERRLELYKAGKRYEEFEHNE